MVLSYYVNQVLRFQAGFYLIIQLKLISTIILESKVVFVLNKVDLIKIDIQIYIYISEESIIISSELIIL